MYKKILGRSEKITDGIHHGIIRSEFFGRIKIDIRHITSIKTGFFPYFNFKINSRINDNTNILRAELSNKSFIRLRCIKLTRNEMKYEDEKRKYDTERK